MPLVEELREARLPSPKACRALRVAANATQEQFGRELGLTARRSRARQSARTGAARGDAAALRAAPARPPESGRRVEHDPPGATIVHPPTGP